GLWWERGLGGGLIVVNAARRPAITLCAMTTCGTTTCCTMTGRSEAMGKQWRVALMAGAVAAVLAGGVACTQGDGVDDSARAQGDTAADNAAAQVDTTGVNAGVQGESAAPGASAEEGGPVNSLRQTASSLFGVIPDPPTEV